MQKRLQKYIGPKSFYKKTAVVAVPLALQQMLSSAMGIVDSLMVSWIGQVTAVGTATQIDTLCSMICYGAIGGTGIFSSQFYGAGDHRNLKRTFGLSLILAFINAVFWLIAACLFGRAILLFYMNDPAIVDAGMQYLQIAMWSLIPSCIQFAFSYIYRSIQKTSITLKVSVFCMTLNACLNYIFIFGIGPFPALGVRGAALGTCISQWICVLLYMTHAIYTKQPFIGSLQEMFHLDYGFVVPILRKIYPLMINEALFGFGSTLFVKAFGQLGKDSMDAYYVSNQIANVFLFVVYGYGNGITVLLGSTLGQGKIKEAIQEGNYYAGLSFVLAVLLVGSMIVFAAPLVSIFQLETDAAYQMAIGIMVVQAVKISMRLYNFMIFSVLKAGGDSKIISLLDSGIMWSVGIPLAFLCVNVLHIHNIALVFLIVQLEQLVRMIIGMKRFFSGIWAKDLTVLVN